MVADVFQSKMARGIYSKVMHTKVEAYMRDLVVRIEKKLEQEIYLMLELKSFFLQMFLKAYSGKGLLVEQEKIFIDYNSALFLLSLGSK